MGRLFLACCLFLVAGCGELTGASELVDGGGGSTEPTTDAKPKNDAADAGASALIGDYYDEPIPETRAVLRLDRKPHSGNPQIVIISTETKTTVPCELFQSQDWQTRMPASAVIHILELGSNVAQTFNVKQTTPPLVDEAYVARGTQVSEHVEFDQLDNAVSGTVTITSYDVAESTGSFSVVFDTYFSDESDEPVPQQVQGSFIAQACSVPW